jgi:hypothetical protein
VFLVGFCVTLFRGEFGDAAFAGFDVVLVGAFAVFMWRQSRLKVIVHDSGLQVVNYLSTFHVAWNAIERFDSSLGYWGIQVRMKDGRTVWLNAIQKWNISAWLNRLTRARRRTRRRGPCCSGCWPRWSWSSRVAYVRRSLATSTPGTCVNTWLAVPIFHSGLGTSGSSSPSSTKPCLKNGSRIIHSGRWKYHCSTG